MPVIKNSVKDIENALHNCSNVIISLNNEQYFLKNENDKIVVTHKGAEKVYSDIFSMEREQMFYGKPLREIIDEFLLGII